MQSPPMRVNGERTAASRTYRDLRNHAVAADEGKRRTPRINL
jgi:hypothetical protein